MSRTLTSNDLLELTRESYRVSQSLSDLENQSTATAKAIASLGPNGFDVANGG